MIFVLNTLKPEYDIWNGVRYLGRLCYVAKSWYHCPPRILITIRSTELRAIADKIEELNK